MSYLSSGSSRSTYVRGIPRRCTCGHPTTILKSTTARNPDREFYRCIVAKDKSFDHVFKWAKESQLEEYDVLSENQEKIVDDIGKILHWQKHMMVTLEQFEEKTKKLESEVENMKARLKKSVLCFAVLGCFYWACHFL